MKKILIMFCAICCLFVFSSCNSGSIPLTEKEKMKTICLDGVTYYFFTETIGYSGYGFMTVKFNRNGTVHTCTNKKENE